MNRENVLKIREDINVAPEQNCSMKYWHCNSVMCIGGYTEARMRAEGVPTGTIFSTTTVGTYLGMDFVQADTLFYHYPETCEPFPNWKEWMLFRLDDILATGVVEDPEGYVPGIDEFADDSLDEITVENYNPEEEYTL